MILIKFSFLWDFISATDYMRASEIGDISINKLINLNMYYSYLTTVNSNIVKDIIIMNEI